MVKIPVPIFSMFGVAKEPSVNLSLPFISVASTLTEVNDPKDEINIIASDIALITLRQSGKRYNNSHVTTYTEVHDSVDLELTELEHIVKAVGLLWMDDSTTPTKAMFSIVNVEWIDGKFTNSSLELVSEPAAPCIGDTTLQYNRIVSNTHFDVSVDINTVNTLPLFGSVTLSQAVVVDNTQKYIVLSDSLLFKEGVVISFPYIVP